MDLFSYSPSIGLVLGLIAFAFCPIFLFVVVVLGVGYLLLCFFNLVCEAAHEKKLMEENRKNRK